MRRINETTDRADPSRRELEGYLSPGGLLARTLEGYESRPQQLDMAVAVARAIREKGRAVVEAGTGTGKTLSYLIPAALSGKKTLISTATKNLQEQIFYKDMALLESVGLQVPVAYLKGRSNYLCRFRFEHFKLAPLFRSPDDSAYFEAILRWAEQTQSGDRAELHDLPDDYPTWSDLSTTPESCLGTECPDYNDCFVTLVRRQAAQAQMIIVNHHLFFGDLAVRSGGYGEVLPDVEVVIFDEAHHLEETATSFFGRSASPFRFRDLWSDVNRALGDLSQPSAELVEELRRCEEESRSLFSAISALFPRQERSELTVEATEHPTVLQQKERTLDSLVRLENRLQATASLGEMAQAFARRCQEIHGDLDFILSASDSSWVYFSEYRGERRWLFLQACPIDLAPVFQEQLYPLHSTTIFTSATLTVGGQFHYFRSRIALGLEETVEELQLASSFDFMEQALLFVPAGLPEPNAPGFVAAIAPIVEDLIELTQGRAFVLFTSYRNMHQLYERLKGRLAYPLLLQGDRSKSALIAQFRETSSVLLATASFWEGVDVPGEKLSLVIMDKLPFASPTDPVIKARIRYIQEQGGDPFQHFQLPQAAISLKQGFGRLIRHREDRGIVAVLDRRLVERSYGRVFLETLPSTRLTRSLEEVRAWWHG